jgi:zinc transport system substrate-binding protein
LRIDLILDIVAHMACTPRLIAAAVGLSLICSCGAEAASNEPSGKPIVAVAFYPLEEIVRAIDPDAVDILTLVPPGEEAHEYEPSARQVGDLQSAQTVFYLGSGFQPDVEKAIGTLSDSVDKVDLLKSIDLLPITDTLHGTEGEAEGEVLETGEDPHVWLDPANMITMATVAAEALGTDATAYVAELRKLDEAFSAGLEHCRSRVIVTSHRAFEYLAHAYDLTQIPIAGVSPTEEPSAKTLQAIAKVAEADDVSTIFFEQNLPDDLAKTVADEVGATTAVLDPLESLSSDRLEAGATYISVMTENLSILRSALGCT